jgi:hypothetical protein
MNPKNTISAKFPNELCEELGSESIARSDMIELVYLSILSCTCRQGQFGFEVSSSSSRELNKIHLPLQEFEGTTAFRAMSRKLVRESDSTDITLGKVSKSVSASISNEILSSWYNLASMHLLSNVRDVVHATSSL